MLTRVLGVNLQEIYMTMLALVGLYLVLTRADQLNRIIRSVAQASTDSLIVLQGRNPSTIGRKY